MKTTTRELIAAAIGAGALIAAPAGAAGAVRFSTKRSGPHIPSAGFAAGFRRTTRRQPVAGRRGSNTPALSAARDALQGTAALDLTLLVAETPI